MNLRILIDQLGFWRECSVVATSCHEGFGVKCHSLYLDTQLMVNRWSGLVVWDSEGTPKQQSLSFSGILSESKPPGPKPPTQTINWNTCVSWVPYQTPSWLRMGMSRMIAWCSNETIGCPGLLHVAGADEKQEAEQTMIIKSYLVGA